MGFFFPDFSATEIPKVFLFGYSGDAIFEHRSDSIRYSRIKHNNQFSEENQTLVIRRLDLNDLFEFLFCVYLFFITLNKQLNLSHFNT